MRKTLTLLYIVAIFAVLLDSIKNPMLIKNFLGVSSGVILFSVFTVIAVLRIMRRRVLSTKAVTTSFFIGISLFCVTAVLATAGVFGGDNFVYSKTFLNLDKLFLLSAFLVTVGIIGQGKFFLNQFQKGIFYFAFFFVILWGFFYSLLPADRFAQLVKEGDLVESLQFLVLVAALYFCIKLIKKLLKSKKTKKHALVFFFIALGIFIVAGDEISWGQKIFSYTPPEFVSQNNSQNEMTLHNTKSIAGYISMIYILIGAYASFAHFFVKERLYAPGKILLPYFFTPALYNTIAFFNIPGIGIWSEPSELLLCMGIAFHLMIIGRGSST